MPAEIVPGEFCSTWYATYRVPSDSDPSVTYRVILNGAEAQPSCTCKAFHYHGGCKHIKFVMDHACLWNCQWYDGNPPLDRISPDAHHLDAIVGAECPNCGGPLISVRIAV